MVALQIAACLWLLFWVGVALFVVRLIYRATIALEKIARHLLEITRTYKNDLDYWGDL